MDRTPLKLTRNSAPHIVTDINELGDKRLDPKENLARLREENARLTARYKIPDQDIFENKDMAAGRMMQPGDFICKIAQLNPAVQVVQGGVPNAVAVRFGPSDDPEEKRLKYISGFYLEPMPEYSSVTVDDRGLPKREIRGWRAVLQSLINARACTYEQCEKIFGPPTGNRAEGWEGRNRNIQRRIE